MKCLGEGGGGDARSNAYLGIQNTSEVRASAGERALPADGGSFWCMLYLKMTDDGFLGAATLTLLQSIVPRCLLWSLNTLCAAMRLLIFDGVNERHPHPSLKGYFIGPSFAASRRRGENANQRLKYGYLVFVPTLAYGYSSPPPPLPSFSLSGFFWPPTR